MGSTVPFAHILNIITSQLIHVLPAPLVMFTTKKKCPVSVLKIILSRPKMDAFNATFPITSRLNPSHAFHALKTSYLISKKEFVYTAQPINL